jgi:hypothetical protein
MAVIDPQESDSAARARKRAEMRQYLEMKDTVEEATNAWLSSMTAKELRHYFYPWARADMSNIQRAAVRRVEVVALPRLADPMAGQDALPGLPDEVVESDVVTVLDVEMIKDEPIWIPSTGEHVLFGDATEAMLKERAEWLVRSGATVYAGCVRTAQRLFFAADLIHQAGVRCLRELPPRALAS